MIRLRGLLTLCAIMFLRRDRTVEIRGTVSWGFYGVGGIRTVHIFLGLSYQSLHICVSITSDNGVGRVHVHTIRDSTAKSCRREVVP